MQVTKLSLYVAFLVYSFRVSYFSLLFFLKINHTVVSETVKN